MIVVNFTRHPVTAVQQEQIRAELSRLEQPVTELRVVELPAGADSGAGGDSMAADHMRDDEPLAPQVRSLVARFGLSDAEWLEAVIIPPSLAPVAAVLTAELHGRLGHFPPILRIQPVAGSVPRQYCVAELIDLQSVRDSAR